MKCHYEILCVSRTADDTEIKAAYRKLALKWHPDKNLDNIEYAKEQFQLVQQAYEVLSDRQERAWYDNHREQILRGSNSEFKDNCLDVYQYFTTSCFKGFEDDDNSFYTVYRNIFEQIAKEDIEFMEDKEEFCNVPMFGISTSNYDEVVAPFYAHWMSYSTKKSYTWLDPYNINESRDRRVLRLIEKENKKVRQKARKERNEEIRALVAFVRKRDKRVQAHNKLLEAKKLENRQKQEMINKKRRLERIKQLGVMNNEAEWSKFDNLQSELREIEKSLAEQFGEELTDSEGEDEDEMVNNLYCVACNKLFKTQKAFENHELSRKHKDNAEKLKESMLDEEQEDISITEEEEDISITEEEEEDISNSNDLTQPKNEENVLDIEENHIAKMNNVEEVIETNKQKKKKKSKNVLTVDNEDEIDKSQQLVVSSDDEFDFGTTKKSKRKNKKNTKTKNTDTINMNENIVLENSENIVDDESQPKKGTKRNKENKKQDKFRSSEETQIDTNHCCVTCKSNFSSKNKLFDHLKKTGHSVYLTQNDKSKKKNLKVK